MNVELNFEQRARLELLSLYAGKTSGEMLLDAAMHLLDSDAGCCPHCRQAAAQTFLADEQVEARFARLLGR